MSLGDIGRGLTPYPYMLILPQDEHERLLIDHLDATGVEVERPAELVSMTQDEARAIAKLRHGDGSEETVEAPTSPAATARTRRVREALASASRAAPMAHLFYVADVDGARPGGESASCTSRSTMPISWRSSR